MGRGNPPLTFMEILKRAKNSEMDIIPFNESESNVRDEVNRRTWKAGITDRDGQQMKRPKIVSKPPSEQYRKNYVRIFGHQQKGITMAKEEKKEVKKETIEQVNKRLAKRAEERSK